MSSAQTRVGRRKISLWSLFMERLWLAPLLLFATAAALIAQDPAVVSATPVVTSVAPVITSATPVNDALLHQWLHSGDPRLIAWAADFTGRTHNAKLIAEMAAMLPHWTIPPIEDADEAQAAQRRAVAAVLDTLIQENAPVSIPAIRTIAEFFPAQAVILIARLPLSESRSTLDDWTYGATGTWNGRTLARIASMMLAKDPGPSQVVWNQNLVSFVASVVGASEEELHINVAAARTLSEGTASGICGTSMGKKLAPGWPQVYGYGVTENDPQAGLQVIVELDGDRIVSTRSEVDGGSGTCYGVKWLDASTRHRLIAHWLGVNAKDMSWQPAEGFTIVWAGKADYQKQLGEITEAQREKLQGTVAALRQRGLLTEAEAATVVPRLIVSVQCAIEPCPLD
jgi:hypothetical protein